MAGIDASTFMQIIVLVFICVFVAIFMSLFLNQMRENRRMQEKLMDIVLHSSFSKKRSDMEESVISMNREFQRKGEDFSDINHVPLRAQKLSEGKSNSFLESLGIVPEQIEQKDRQIFVLTPFSNVETDTFLTVRNILLDAGFYVFRGDEKKRTDIFPHIVRSIVESQLIIANLNGRNPNVMYELGVAHMLGKPVILMAKFEDDLSSIPFDLRTKNLVLYERDDEIREKLLEAVLQVLS